MKTTEKRYCYKYPHAALTADCVIYGFDGSSLKVLLVERGGEPFKGMWALPGGFMHMDETIEEAARRELLEETGLSGVYMEQFKVFSDIRRDPRERVVTVVFITLVRSDQCQLMAGDDAADARWFDVDFLPPLAFDHAEILNQARTHVIETLKVRPIAFQLLNKYFSLSELQDVYEAITGREYDRRNFQRKALQSGVLAETTPMPNKGAKAMRPPSVECACAESRPKVGLVEQPKRGRKSKLFRLLFEKSENNDDDSEASIKDLFNFRK